MLNPLTRKTDETPGALAAELADARVAFETVRANIIDRGVARQQAINEMILELEDEEAALAGVVADAQTD
jgi:hypothetical protein